MPKGYSDYSGKKKLKTSPPLEISFTIFEKGYYLTQISYIANNNKIVDSSYALLYLRHDNCQTENNTTSQEDTHLVYRLKLEWKTR